MNRQSLVDHDRLATNVSTETYQPYHGTKTIKPQPLDQQDGVGVVSVIKRGPNGVGAHFSFTEPVGSRWHEVHGAEPIISRAVGA